MCDAKKRLQEINAKVALLGDYKADLQQQVLDINQEITELLKEKITLSAKLTQEEYHG